MKRTFGALALLVVVAGCPKRDQQQDAGVVDAGPEVLAEQEPNDQREQALEVARSSLVNASLSADPARPDEDWYLLRADTPKTADVSVAGIPGGDVKLEVYDADRNLLVAVNAGGLNEGERIPNLGVRGVQYLRVISAKKGAGGAYTLTALLGEPEPGLEWEPNDRAADGNVLALAQPVAGVIGHPGDEDWFTIELVPDAGTGEPAEGSAPGADDGGAAAAPAGTGEGAPQITVRPPGGEGTAGEPPPGGEGAPPSDETADGGVAAAPAGAPPPEPPGVALKIDVSGVPGVRLEVQVLSAAEALLFGVKGEEGQPLSLRNVGVRSTDQVVHVVIKSAWSGVGKDAKRGFDPQARYQLSVTLEEAGANAELEPNEEAGKATSLPENGFRLGFLSPKSDVDYYVLRPSQPVIARVQLSGVERLDLSLSLVEPPTETNAAEQVVSKVNDGTVKEPEYLNGIFCADACYLRVEGAVRKVDGKWVRDFENAELPYRLTIASAPDTGVEEREPNGTTERATPVAFGRPLRGTIHPRKDVDYYRVDLSGRPVRTALKATVLGILKVDVGLYLHRVKEDGSLSLVQTADRGKGEAPETIRYSAEPGVYLFEVRDSKGRESNFQDSYQLTIEEER